MEKSESIKNLAEALAKAQGEFKPAELNSVNPFLKNKYADLGSIIEASRTALAANGLAVVQIPTISDENLTVTMTVMHSSGEWFSSSLSLKISSGKGMSEAQSMGSTITYLRRYLWSSVLGIYTGDDTDGNKDDRQEKKPTKPVKTYDSDVHQPPPEPRKAPEPPVPVTPEDALRIKDAINRVILYVDKPTKAAFDASTKPDKWSAKTLEFLEGKAVLTKQEITDGVKEIAQAYGDTSQEALDFDEAVSSQNWLRAIEMKEAAYTFIVSQEPPETEPPDDPRTGND